MLEEWKNEKTLGNSDKVMSWNNVRCMSFCICLHSSAYPHPCTHMLNGHRCVGLTLAGWPLPLCLNLMSCRGRDNTSQCGSISSTRQYSAPLSQTQRECTCLEVRLWHKACREPDVSEACCGIDASTSTHLYPTKKKPNTNGYKCENYACESLLCKNTIKKY